MIKFADTGEKITYVDGGAPTVEDAERMAAASGRVVEVTTKQNEIYEMIEIAKSITKGCSKTKAGDLST